MRYSFLLVKLLITLLSFSQQIVVEKIKLTETMSNKNVSEIPRLKDLSNEKNPVVEKINAKILEIFIINSFKQKEIEHFTWFDVTFESEIKDEILYISYSGEYYGAYPNLVEEEIFFSLKSGEPLAYKSIPFQSLFTLSGYLDFLNKYWLKDIEQEFKEATECAGFEPHCSYYDIDYSFDNKKLSASLTIDCYPRVALACAPEKNISIEIDSIKEYLNEVGKYIFFKSNYSTKSPIEKFLENNKLKKKMDNNLFIFAKIDNKYPISMAVTLVDEEEVSGYYYYDKKKQKLSLKGKRTDNLITLTEKINGKETGYFEFTILNKYKLNSFLLSAQYGNDKYISGKWMNSNKTKEFNIMFTEIKKSKY